ncbi:MAG: YhcH/YjgK/YiaL family protein [Treponema sp.]|jgi:YhcH/YjgK/YiaL family protein|nr:YhcH/YjgK/YiaL family protein [Treponema sp.]
MIFAPKNNLERYRVVSANMGVAIDYLLQNNMESLLPCKVEINDNVYMLVQYYDTGSHTERKFEAHDQYIDIQFYLSGEEFIYVEDRSKLHVAEAYNAERDVVKFHDTGAHSVRLFMTPGSAAIFFPEDGHKPNCMIDDMPKPVKKIVMKVRL